MLGTAGEVRAISYTMFSYGLLQIDAGWPAKTYMNKFCVDT